MAEAVSKHSSNGACHLAGRCIRRSRSKISCLRARVIKSIAWKHIMYGAMMYAVLSTSEALGAPQGSLELVTGDNRMKFAVVHDISCSKRFDCALFHLADASNRLAFSTCPY